jgi:hypothetical protein
VVRYDSAYGFAHVDILNRPEDVEEELLLLPEMPLKEALKLGIEAIKANWIRYR